MAYKGHSLWIWEGSGGSSEGVDEKYGITGFGDVKWILGC